MKLNFLIIDENLFFSDLLKNTLVKKFDAVVDFQLNSSFLEELINHSIYDLVFVRMKDCTTENIFIMNKIKENNKTKFIISASLTPKEKVIELLSHDYQTFISLPYEDEDVYTKCKKLLSMN